MAKKPKNDVIVSNIPNNVQANVALTTDDLANMGVGDDLVKVGISRARKKLNEQFKAIQDEIDECDKTIEAKEKEANKLAETAALKHVDKSVKAAPAFFQTFGYKTVKAKVEVVSLEGTFDGKKKDTVFEKFSFKFFVAAKDHESIYSKSQCMKCPTNLRTLLEKILESRKYVEKRKKDGVEIKRKIANLPNYKEDLEAKMAQARLQNSETGTAVLDRLEADLDEDLKLLSVN